MENRVIHLVLRSIDQSLFRLCLGKTIVHSSSFWPDTPSAHPIANSIFNNLHHKLIPHTRQQKMSINPLIKYPRQKTRQQNRTRPSKNRMNALIPTPETLLARRLLQIPTPLPRTHKQPGPNTPQTTSINKQHGQKRRMHPRQLRQRPQRRCQNRRSLSRIRRANNALGEGIQACDEEQDCTGVFCG